MFKEKIISIQGQKGSYHDIVCKYLFGKPAKILERLNFKQVFDDIEKNKADYAIVAIENSLVGSINEVYDLLRIKQHLIVGEHYEKVTLCLVSLPSANKKDITNVYSHPMALLQSESYLKRELPQADIHERHDTAESAVFVATQNDKTKAAIASRQAAKLYDLKILEEKIETDKDNYTRFIVLKRKNKVDKNLKMANKTSVVVELSHEPGSLYRALGCFEREKINLSKIESRPIIGKSWRYYFYLDFEAGINEDRVKRAIECLEKQGHNLTVLGSYRRDEVIA
ncbi:MAG: prephenate dehydratase [bacterium]|nr:prephenate dehydratase [bacterium]